MTQGISKQYYGRIIQFQWQSFPVVREKAFEVQMATNALEAAIAANNSEGEIDRLTSLKNDAQTALTAAIAANEDVDYTVGFFESEDAYNQGELPVFSESYKGHVKPEHQTLYAGLAAALYADFQGRT